MGTPKGRRSQWCNRLLPRVNRDPKMAGFVLGKGKRAGEGRDEPRVAATEETYRSSEHQPLRGSQPERQYILRVNGSKFLYLAHFGIVLVRWSTDCIHSLWYFAGK